MAQIKVAVINDCTVLKDDDIKPVVDALQAQVREDFAPIWKIDADLVFVPSGGDILMDAWWLPILDHSDQAGCFTGDTKISLLNGIEITLKDLSERHAGSKFWVYSYDVESGQIAPGLAHSPRLTKRSAAIVRVTLDNGAELKCTPDHKFLLKDGTYREAVHLKVGDSLMPLYRRLSTKSDNIIGYEIIHAGDPSKGDFTHRVSADVANIGCCAICGIVLPEKKHGYRHHRDFNKLNNSPDNFQWLTKDEHFLLHSKVGADNLRRLRENPEFRRKQAAAISATGKRTGPIYITRYNKSDKHRKRARELLLKNWADPEWVSKIKPHCVEGGKKEGGRNLLAYLKSEEGKEHSRKMAAAHLVPYARSDVGRANARMVGPKNLIAYNISDIGRAKARETALQTHRDGRLSPVETVTRLHREGRLPGFKNFNHVRWHVQRNIVSSSCSLCASEQANHKVVAVEILNETQDVYDITVEKYHNFALSSGIFVHNSLGYHDESPLGFPQGKVFAGDDLRAGASWSNTASHELLEMLADPEIVECTLQYLPDGKKRLVAREICDPCPEDSQGYQKNGVLVSDFVSRDWFVGWSQGYPGVKYDFLGKIGAPFQLLGDGYIGVMDIQAGASWTQVNAQGLPHRKGNAAPIGSRRERRKTPRNQWKRSTYP